MAPKRRPESASRRATSSSRNRHADTLRVRDVEAVLASLAPLYLAAEWDNVGLLAGCREWPCRRALVTGDLTPDVLDEAIAGRADLVIAYHPPIFKPVARFIVGRDRAEGVAAEALANRIAVYSPHTAWDAAPGGTNDTIAALCGATDVRPMHFAPPKVGREVKLVTFVPTDALERVAEALFAAGAGQIGNYSQCSFRIPGEGTFFGSDETDPTVGKKGRLERVREIRLEVIVPGARVNTVVAALRRAHPYEEPAFDVYPLLPAPRTGQGRIGRLSNAPTAARLAARLRQATLAANVNIVGKPAARVETVFICVGSAGSLPFEAEGGGPSRGSCIITGEIRHHDALRIARSGATAIALGHWASERPGVAALAKQLGRALRGVDVRLSRADCDPFTPA